MTHCRDIFTSMRQIRDTVIIMDGRQLVEKASRAQGAYLRRDGEMLAYARRLKGIMSFARRAPTGR